MKKKHIIWIVVIALFIASFFIFRAPEYNDPGQTKPVLGDESSSVRLVEYADFQCPACAATHPVMKQVLDEYGDRISYEYKHFPLTSIHPQAFKAAEASECAADQGSFTDYMDILFANQNALDQRSLIGYAEDLGMDADLFSICLRSGEKAKYVEAERRQAIAQGLRGTPSVLLNGQQVRHDYASLTAALDQTLGE